MAEEYKFHLAKWHERDKTLRCPGCGRGHGCFKEYVDIEGTPVDNLEHTVGKCDHEQTCGYHLTPKEWFKTTGNSFTASANANRPQRPAPKMITIEPHWVGDFYRNTTAVGNNLLRWVATLPMRETDRKALEYIIRMYAIGTTQDGRVIWWQIDEMKRVRTGKIMAYDQTGHRLKDAEGNSVGFGWVHSMFRKLYGIYPEKEGWELQQCLFGQHLLPAMPEASVHIVESEKTALIMSLLDEQAFTKNIWLATGGLYNLNASKLYPMKGRKIYCYPDVNGIDKWREAIKGTEAKLATGWMDHWTEADGKGADIADVMIRIKGQQTTANVQRQNPILENPIVRELINDLQLEVIRK